MDHVHLGGINADVPDVVPGGNDGRPAGWGYIPQFRNVGAPTRGSVSDVGWTGDELVAFRVHLPSKITFHNSQNFERGNTLVWEQRLRDRLAGAPLHLDARMETQSILYRTLWLFAGTFLAAIAALMMIVWWIGRKGRSMVPA